MRVSGFATKQNGQCPIGEMGPLRGRRRIRLGRLRWTGSLHDDDQEAGASNTERTCREPAKVEREMRKKNRNARATEASAGQEFQISTRTGPSMNRSVSANRQLYQLGRVYAVSTLVRRQVQARKVQKGDPRVGSEGQKSRELEIEEHLLPCEKSPRNLQTRQRHTL